MTERPPLIAVAEDLVDQAYGCFSSGHKFCREVCPVMQVTRNESHTPTAFHANVVAMSQGHLDLAQVADDYVHCTMCGACELRCPNTLFVGDFYRNRTRTVELVKKMRSLAVAAGLHQPAWQRWVELTMEHKNEPVVAGVTDPARAKEWARDLGLPIGGSTVLFVDCEAAFFRRSVPRAVSMILRAAGVEFGLMREQWCCGGPAAEMGYEEQARQLAEHNVADWRSVGAERIVVLDPHDYITFTEDYPKYFGDEFDFEVLFITELLADLFREGRITFTKRIERTVTYHDPCRLNKRKGIHASPRELLRAIPGLTFHDIDHVTQWAYCSGGGGGLPVAKPEITAEISRRRVEAAKQLGVDTLVSACVWSERPLTAAADGLEQPLAVVDIVELVAEAMGLDIAEVPA